MRTLASVELGGTKTLVGVGSDAGDVTIVARLPTSDDPHRTTAAVAEAIAGEPAKALGIASFGPLNLDVDDPRFGFFESTPKEGWSGFDLLGELSSLTGLPGAIDTDVNAAALAEGNSGAAKGCRVHAYVTVGTGVGFGLSVNGDRVLGTKHAEMGHVSLSRLQGDEFEGVCPFHGDCLEGMASGAALEERFGAPVEMLDRSTQIEARDLAAFYLGQGLRALNYTVAPERVVIGGGVSHLDGFHDSVEVAFRESLSGYREPPVGSPYVVAPGHGDISGLVGGLLLASDLES